MSLRSSNHIYIYIYMYIYIYIYYVSTTAGLSSAEPTPPSPKEGGAAVCMTDDAQGLLWIGRGVSSTVKCPPHSRYTYIFESANTSPVYREASGH